MRRALLAITGLAAGTTALVVLKGAPGTSQAAQDRPVAEAPVVPGGSAAPGPAPGGVTPSARPGASAKPSAKAGASRAPGTRTSATTRVTTRATTAAPRTTTSAPKVTTRTVTGPVVSYRYGSLQVRITLSGSRIVDATGLGMPLDGQSGLRSDDVQARYSGSSGEVVAKQSANLNTVSGATYTSTAYKQSLQAALDKA
ncbi:FMN-binding protein [Micromonospora terminaliae]|uniref:FMN-binding protein n=1 Tax=Micromonospora terminaliae TaxID=1914461 RepID=A0AAJ3DKF6_9ACTN|nr:FMN-binding protein [Micromonospora terminaliae]NES29328.1 FMN-binding protein [Micromonospora terminaliae]QGL48694.1 FMN-binding protein [Micromonospora terminaliae]